MPTTAVPMASAEQVESLVRVLDAVRSSAASTRPEIARTTGLGRNVVTQRVTQLVAAGLLAESELGRSTGGRAPRALRFRADAGLILAVELGATSIGVAAADLAGNVTHRREEPADITVGPDAVLTRVSDILSELLAEVSEDRPLWGIGVALPGPVEFKSGTPISPPIMPGWDGYDVRGFFQDRFDAPVWVDNDVNVMALGELRGGSARGEQDVIYVKVGSGIGAGLVSGGRLHRGAQGCAGDIGHVAVGDRGEGVVCRCGQTGCLEALAGGFALARDGAEAARRGDSRLLAQTLESGEPVTAETVIWAAQHGDPVAVELVTTSARMVGESLARMVNFFNPSLILLGGGVSSAGDLYLAEIRQTIFARSLPLATRSLRVVPSPLTAHSGLRGAAFMVVDELFSPERLGDILTGHFGAKDETVTA